MKMMALVHVDEYVNDNYEGDENYEGDNECKGDNDYD